MKKIKYLVVGQAPPAVKQVKPYDTTMWYEWLDEADIPKDIRGEIEYEATYGGPFLGWSNGGHRVPNRLQKEQHWQNRLKEKVVNSEKVLALGNVAYDWLQEKGVIDLTKVIHPSYRNKSRFDKTRDQIIGVLREFFEVT